MKKLLIASLAVVLLAGCGKNKEVDPALELEKKAPPIATSTEPEERPALEPEATSMPSEPTQEKQAETNKPVELTDADFAWFDDAMEKKVFNPIFYQTLSRRNLEDFKKDIKKQGTMETLYMMLDTIPPSHYPDGYIEQLKIRLSDLFNRVRNVNGIEEYALNESFLRTQFFINLSAMPNLPEEFYVYPGTIGLSHDGSTYLIDEKMIPTLQQDILEEVSEFIEEEDVEALRKVFASKDIEAAKKEFTRLNQTYQNTFIHTFVVNDGDEQKILFTYDDKFKVYPIRAIQVGTTVTPSTGR